MKLSMNWLSDFTDVKDVDIKAYCDRMTDTGSKVEGYETLAEDISGVVCGHVLSVEKHPDADKLVVCSVDIGRDAPVQIVTAATNVTPGAVVPVATDGSHLPGGVKIKKGKLRGVVSEGMFCSIAELGLTLHDMPGAIEDGILILGDCGLGDIAPGTDMKEALLLTDNVVEFEITSNRPDCLSVIGLGRESAVSFDRDFTVKAPEVKHIDDGDTVENHIKVDIKAPDLCYRYSAAVVKNVRIKPSPLWLRMRLRASGVRPINNIVDITNYVMLEYGQPMHAFDYACLEGKHIIVRRAEDNEEYVTLDNIKHNLNTDMLVIADEKKPVALAGVMGGANSGISDSTVKVVFESAVFNGGNVRRSAKALGMRTESSSRFEKGLDAEGTMNALKRACELVNLLDAGDVVADFIDCYPEKKEAFKMELCPETINTFLGTDMTEEFMKDTLCKLAFEVDGNTITVPSFRDDVRCMNDVAEEVIRIYGYNSIVSTGFSSGLAEGGRTEMQKYALDAEEALVGMGADQIETFSFISPKYYDKIRLAADDPRRKSVVIMNPLGEDTSVMRTTALPSILEVLALNYNRKNRDVFLFELGSVYLPKGDDELPDEPRRITLGLLDYTKDQLGFYRMKGYIEALLDRMGVRGVSYKANSDESAFHPGRCASVMVDGKCIGVFGELHPETADNYGFGNVRVLAAELDFDMMFELRFTDMGYTPLPKYPALERDFSFVCEEALEAGSIEACIKKAGGAVLESAKLFDVYRGPQVGEGKKSLSFEVKLRAADKTLSDSEADTVVEKILGKISEEFGIELRK
ncbi:MAG: phenylalanine--tRNA ligase subunit beta [Ruminococcaceae bacterium]|nr:phenylalanine--tRNA ligase subunit beta [Oscillospiraceae bacterium]